MYRKKQLEDIAKKGDFSTKILLFPNEIRALRKEHCKVIAGTHKGRQIFCDVDWTDAFKEDFPLALSNYITGSAPFPDEIIKNFAEKLYVLAEKAQFEQ